VNHPTVSFYTLGCRLNQSETAVLKNLLAQKKYPLKDCGRPTDVVVINTCTVTANSDTDTRKLVNRVVRANPDVKIALIGCQAQIQREKLLALPNVRWVIGTADKMNLPAILNGTESAVQPQLLVSGISRAPFTLPAPGIDHSHTRANIKIQDGCDTFCSYCVVPYARGRARSRRFEDIIIEAKALAASGHQELVITGINVGKYSQAGKNILDVIRALERITPINRIRISSIEPTTIPENILPHMAGTGKLCRHLHIPLQSASDKILELMRRPYTLAKFDKFIRAAAETVPDICIGTDAIVGFPGETEDDFNTTYAYLKTAPINYLHVFSYSPRELAKSRHLPNPVPVTKIKERSEKLRRLGSQKRQEYYERFIGRTVTVLFEQKKKGLWNGLTDNFLHAQTRSHANLANQFRDIRLAEIHGQVISGKLLNPD